MTDTYPTHRALIVTGADYNGSEFDGAPVNTFFPMPEGGTVNAVAVWFLEAIESKQIIIEARGDTDYAWFGVKDNYGNLSWAGPGDMIAKMGHSGDIIVIPRPVVKYMERLFRHSGAPPFDIGVFVKLQADLMQFHGELRPL